MIERLVTLFTIGFIIVGVIICIANITSIDLGAGQIVKYGTYRVDYAYCPAPASNCVDIWYIPDKEDGN